AKQVIPQLEKNGKVDRAYLGVTSAQISKQIAHNLNLPTSQGALVQSVVPNGPADKAGIHGGDTGLGSGSGQLPGGGARPISVDGHKIMSPEDVAAAIANDRPGKQVQVTLLRDGKQKTVTVTLGTRPSQVPGQSSQSGGGNGGTLPFP